MKSLLKKTAFIVMMTSFSAFGNVPDKDTVINKINAKVLPQIKRIVSDKELIESVKAQNIEHASITQSDIDKLDK